MGVHPHVVDAGSERIGHFEIVQKANTSGGGDYRGNSNGMEVEALRRMANNWEDDQKVAVVVIEDESRMAKVIRASHWSVRHK
jgi:hypothetical protein